MLKGSCIASYKWTKWFWKLLSQFKETVWDWGSEVNSTFKNRFSYTFNVAISQISSWTAIKASKYFKIIEHVFSSFFHWSVWTDCHAIEIPFSNVGLLAYVIHIEIIYAWWQHFTIVFKTDCVSSPLYRIDLKNKWLYRSWTLLWKKVVWRLAVALSDMCFDRASQKSNLDCNDFASE